jgi:hypothetical protein
MGLLPIKLRVILLKHVRANRALRLQTAEGFPTKWQGLANR